MPQVCVLDDTVYQRDVRLFIGTRDQLARYLRTKWGYGARRIPKRATAASFTVPVNDYLLYVVWLSDWDSRACDWATLAHECYHTVVSVFEELRVKMDEEAVAYYLESMVEQFGGALEST